MLVRIIKDWNKNDDIPKQSINHSGKWGEFEFTFEPVESCDFVVFTNRVAKDSTITCREGGRLLLQMEPPTPAHRWYRDSDRYFDRIIGPDCKSDPRKRDESHGALPWHIGLSYDELESLEVSDKFNSLSMITSNLQAMNGHCLRLEMVREKELGNVEFDLYGRGFNEISDKLDGLYPYKYSLIIENSFYPHYWTEKLADCFLAHTVPIYVGASNIFEYFPRKSIIKVNPSVNDIKGVINSLNSDDWDSRQPAVEKARRLILGEYQIFPFLEKKLSQLIDEGYIGEKKKYTFEKNSAPWEGGKVSKFRKVEYKIRKLANRKPY